MVTSPALLPAVPRFPINAPRVLLLLTITATPRAMEVFLETAAPVASISKLSRFSALMVTVFAFVMVPVISAVTSWDTMDTPAAAATETGFSCFVVEPVAAASFFAVLLPAAPFPVVPTEPVETVVVSSVFAPAAERTLEERLALLLVVSPLSFNAPFNRSLALLLSEPVPVPLLPLPELFPEAELLPVPLPSPNALPDKISAILLLYLSL